MDAKNLKEVIVAGCKGYQAYVMAKKDGKIDGADLLYLIPFAQAVGPAVQDINLVPAEGLDLDKAELVDIVQAVQAECPELKDAAQALIRIEAVLNLLLASKDCYLAFSNGVPSGLKLAGLDMGAAAAAVKIVEIQAAKVKRLEAGSVPAAEPKAAEVEPSAVLEAERQIPGN